MPPPQGYRRTEGFYRVRPGSAAAKALQHPLDMSRLARRLRRAARGVVHFQWLPIPALDRLLVRAFPRPVVLTAHDVLPREVRRGGGAGSRALLRAVDAVVVHSEAGRSRLVAEAGVDPARVHVIPHGAFEHLDRAARRDAACPGGPRRAPGRAVLRPRAPVQGSRPAGGGVCRARPTTRCCSWSGMPRTPIEPLERRARELGIAERVRFVPRFVPDEELPSYFRRADVVALPYREIDQSGVLYTALAFGSPLLLSAVGGFPEIAARGAARLVEPGSVESLRAGLVELLADEAAGAAPCRSAALRLAREEHSWERGGRGDRAAVPAAAGGACRDGGRDRILGLGGPDRLHARRAIRCCSPALRDCGAARCGGPAELPRVSLVVAAHDERDVIEEKVQECARARLSARPAGGDRGLGRLHGRHRRAGARRRGGDPRVRVLDLDRRGKVRAQDAAVDAAARRDPGLLGRERALGARTRSGRWCARSPTRGSATSAGASPTWPPTAPTRRASTGATRTRSGRSRAGSRR